jgi:hypothetical protein
MRVFLSAPYSGALYWWFENLAGTSPDDQPASSYLGYLHKGGRASIDVALTSLIVYDEIVLPFADNHRPGGGNLRDLRMGDLGLSVADDQIRRAGPIADRWLKDLTNEAGIQELLRAQGLSDWEERLEIEYAIADILITQDADIAVVASPGRQRLARRIVSLGVLDDDIDGANRLALTRVDEAPAYPVAEYVDLIGLTIRRDDYGAIVDLKHDPTIAQYSKSFRSRLGPSATQAPIDFADALAEVLEKHASQGTVQGIFKHSGRVLDLAGLIPGVGTAAGLLGIAGEAGETFLEGLRYTHWHELGSAIKAREFQAAMQTRAQKNARQTADELLSDLGFDDGNG